MNEGKGFISEYDDGSNDRILFQGFTFTMTDLSKKEKAQISNIIATMGGKVKEHLTTDTNVLIVGNINTPKSQFCLKNRNDVTLLYPDDLYDIFKRFKEKSIKNLTIQILDDYPWPIFHSCLFCLSRLRDVDNPCYDKDYITKLIEYFGGKSISSLTPRVTYLITDKREGKRYESAIDWKIHAIHPKWIIDCCKCQRILNPALYDISVIKNSNEIGNNAFKEYRNIIDYGSTKNNPIYNSIISEKNKNKDDINNIKNNLLLFKGLIFSCFGFTSIQLNKLIEILKLNGAEIQEEYDLSVTHVLIPSTFTFDQIPEKVVKLMDISDSKIINEWFIERCLFYKKICTDSWSLPPKYLRLDYKLKIHITGFIGIEHLHITKLIKNLNLTIQTELTKDCNFLLANLLSLGLNKSNSPQLFKYEFNDILNSITTINTSSTNLTKKKINSAKKWNIPVVSLAFLWELSQRGVLPQVLDTKWCIFAPRSLKPASNFLEYARALTGPSFREELGECDNGNDANNDNYNNESQNDKQDDKDTAKDNDSYGVSIPVVSDSYSKVPAQLPSPRKNAAKKWPKLVGTASESQLKSMDDNLNIKNFTKDDYDDNDEYNFKGKRRLAFDNTKNGKSKDTGRYLDFDDDLGVEDMPIFKKRRK